MLGKRCAVLGLGIFASICFIGCGGSSKPVSVAVTATEMTVDGADSITLTATVTNDKNSAGVTWTVSGGGTLSNTSATSATYTAPAAASTAVTATITATSVAKTAETATITITVPATPAITTASSGLSSTVGSAYSVQLSVSGGISPYTWTVSTGSLPSCLTLTPAGLVSGTVSAACAGTFTPTFTVTDSGTPTKLTATEKLTIVIAVAPAIAFTGTMPATATYNVAYTGSAAATGGAGALTYSLSASALPTGLGLNASTGAVTGTPTVGGAFNFTVKAADAFGDSATKGYTVTVGYPAMTITTASLPTGYLGSTYTSTTLAATGGTNLAANYSWALANSTTLPAGLQLSAAGVISGKPTGLTTGTINFSVTVTDTVASISATGPLSIVIKPAVSITTAATLPTGYVGSSYSQTLAATGGSGSGYTWAVS
ncbi:MAG: putative Ig domain-containing protein, partial [Terracidiphilus sp.]